MKQIQITYGEVVAAALAGIADCTQRMHKQLALLDAPDGDRVNTGEIRAAAKTLERLLCLLEGLELRDVSPDQEVLDVRDRSKIIRACSYPLDAGNAPWHQVLSRIFDFSEQGPKSAIAREFVDMAKGHFVHA